MSAEKPTLWCCHVFLPNGQRLDDLKFFMDTDNEHEVMEYMRQAVRNGVAEGGLPVVIGYVHVVEYEEPPMLESIIITSIIAFLQFKGALNYIYEQIKKGQS